MTMAPGGGSLFDPRFAAPGFNPDSHQKLTLLINQLMTDPRIDNGRGSQEEVNRVIIDYLQAHPELLQANGITGVVFTPTTVGFAGQNPALVAPAAPAPVGTGPTPIPGGGATPEPGGPVGGGVSGPTPIAGGPPTATPTPTSTTPPPTATPGPVAPPGMGGTQDELKKQVQIALANKDPDLARKLAEAWFLANKFGDPKKAAADFLSKISPVSDEAARAERFGGTAGGRAGIFGEFLRQQNPNYDLFTPGVQATMERDLPALEESFMLEPANFGGAGEGKGPSTSFEQMLKSGRPAMSPNEIQSRLVNVLTILRPSCFWI